MPHIPLQLQGTDDVLGHPQIHPAVEILQTRNIQSDLNILLMSLVIASTMVAMVIMVKRSNQRITELEIREKEHLAQLERNSEERRMLREVQREDITCDVGTMTTADDEIVRLKSIIDELQNAAVCFATTSINPTTIPIEQLTPNRRISRQSLTNDEQVDPADLSERDDHAHLSPPNRTIQVDDRELIAALRRELTRAKALLDGQDETIASLQLQRRAIRKELAEIRLNGTNKDLLDSAIIKEEDVDDVLTDDDDDDDDDDSDEFFLQTTEEKNEGDRDMVDFSLDPTKSDGDDVDEDEEVAFWIASSSCSPLRAHRVTSSPRSISNSQSVVSYPNHHLRSHSNQPSRSTSRACRPISALNGGDIPFRRPLRTTMATPPTDNNRHQQHQNQHRVSGDSLRKALSALSPGPEGQASGTSVDRQTPLSGRQTPSRRPQFILPKANEEEEMDVKQTKQQGGDWLSAVPFFSPY